MIGATWLETVMWTQFQAGMNVGEGLSYSTREMCVHRVPRTGSQVIFDRANQSGLSTLSECE